ncbi:hypothetical protein N8768_02045 [Flavobacteriaceae bacterium]|mgnify:CR=1 FL=1|jgi:hypothetical protein|nr:hypothetical protein [Flavobacteriaceae bacterium]
MKSKLKQVKTPGYIVPKDYFVNLEEVVSKKIYLRHRLGEVNDPGFKVPKRYFSTFEERTYNIIHSQETSVKSIPLFSMNTILHLSGIAAALLILAAVLMPTNNLSLDNIEIELVETFITINDFDSSELALIWDTSEINSIEFYNYEFLDETINNYIIDDLTIEDFLIE